MSNIDNILAIVKSARGVVDKNSYAPLTMHQAEQMVEEIERLRRLDSTELSIKCYDAGYEKGQHDAKAGYESMLRDQFAKIAMQAIVSNIDNSEMAYTAVARVSWSAADAMMKERRNTHD